MKNNIKINRLMKSYSQEQLANLVSVSRQTINALEAEKYVPSTVLALKLSKILEKSIEELFELEKKDF
ncbi:helix-turn-helix transcriptional regulator [Sphingobacterium hungaricum]|uniref:Transcriptional regulator n=1 Tax=Sphingobacterium hungaricum TaxID=2082723 RepID=A0A928UXI0_9SPHI|nr:helix-turn-helix transcriptional regulator [Sphingobacterium hungaricum]MBE8713165.1 transcriptional regulator [Sphingobacterium hungaricum]